MPKTPANSVPHPRGTLSVPFLHGTPWNDIDLRTPIFIQGSVVPSRSGTVWNDPINASFHRFHTLGWNDWNAMGGL